MDYFTFITTLAINNLPYVLLAMTAMLMIALVIFININLKLNRMNRRYKRMMEGMEGVNLERLLMAHINEVKDTTAKVEKLSEQCSELQRITGSCIQNVGIVRFSAFEDTGSDLSFAVALLDRNENGVVISSIFGRSESRTYAKPITGGQSSYFLTDEEKEALIKAKNKEKITK